MDVGPERNAGTIFAASENPLLTRLQHVWMIKSCGRDKVMRFFHFAKGFRPTRWNGGFSFSRSLTMTRPR